MTLESHDRAFVRFRATGRPADLADVFDATAVELRRVARHLVQSAEEADDLVQDTFLAAIEDREGFAPGEPVLPWLLGILANRARRGRRERGRSPDPARVERPAPVRDPAEEASADELHRELGRALGELPEPYGSLLGMHLVEGLGAQEIAARVERPAGSVRKQLSRGMDRLRLALPASLAGAILASSSLRGMAPVREVVLARARALAGAEGGGAVGLGRATSLVGAKGLAWGLVAALLVVALTVSFGSFGSVDGRGHGAGAVGELERGSADDPAGDRLAAARAIRRRADEDVVLRGRIQAEDLASLAIRDFAWLQRERGESGPQLGRYRLEVAADGSFEMRLPAELLQGVGRFLIATADREFGAWVSRPLVPAADGSFDLGRVVLAPAPRVVVGQVLDPEGRPVADALLAVLEPTGGRDARGDEYLAWLHTLRSDERGGFDVALWTACDELQMSLADQGRLVGRKTRFRLGAEGVVVHALQTGRLHGRIAGALDLPYGTLQVDGLCNGRVVLGSIPVSADGRFEAWNVQPDRYDLRVVSSFTGEVLARLDGVEVPSGGPALHPGLDALSLDVGARFLQVQVVDEEGSDLGEYLVVHGSAVGGAPHPGQSVLGPRFVVATADDGCDLVVKVPERRLALLAGLRNDARVAVLPPIDVDLRIDWEAVGFPRGLRLHLDLELPDQQGIRPAVDSRGTYSRGDAIRLLVDRPGDYVLRGLALDADDRPILVDGRMIEIVNRPVTVPAAQDRVEIAVEFDWAALAKAREAVR